MDPNPPQNPTPPSPEDQERLIKERFEKAARLTEETGWPLFANRFIPAHHAEEIKSRQAELVESHETVTVSGRVMIVRSFGKAGFFVLRDQTGDIQVYVKAGETDEAGFELYKKWLDAGDIVGVSGAMFITKHGELTIKAATVQLLTKSMRPLPEKWHGLKDVELRYRQRYVDLIANPEVGGVFRTRSRIIAFLRRFLDERGYMEVETPMMQAIYGGAAAKPFITKHNALDMTLFLRIAPELFLKRLVVGGFERVYEINRNFRNEGLSTRHNPEFTMLELYTAGWNYRDTMDLTETLIRETAQAVLGSTKIKYHYKPSDPIAEEEACYEIDLSIPFQRIKILDAVSTALNLPDANDLRWGMDKQKLRDVIVKHYPEFEDATINRDNVVINGTKLSTFKVKISPGPKFKDNENAFVRVLNLWTSLGETWTSDEALMNVFEREVEGTLAQPTFVIDYPMSLCPLTKRAPGDPATAERFEFFCCGMEMANAYSELNDPAEQLAKFEEQVGRRAAGDEEAMSDIDRDYVRALEYGMPPCSGLGIGIDRLVMLLTDSPSIRDVILFPQMRPEK